MKKTMVLLLAIMLLLACTPAMALDWKYESENLGSSIRLPDYLEVISEIKSKEEQEVKSSKVSTPRPLPPKPTSNLSIEDINRMLPILEKQRKEIDSRIVKIDLNAPFENDIDLTEVL